MGACCTKFGSYLLRKEESKVLSNGGTPKLINKLEHKQSFVVAHNTYEEKPPTDENIDLSPQHHEDKPQLNKEDADSHSKENSETEVKVVTGAVIKDVIRSNSTSSSSSSDSESLENGTNSGNDQNVFRESDIKQDLGEIPRTLFLAETLTPENKEVDKSSSSSEDENEETTAEASQKRAEPEAVIVTVVESANDPETKSISSKNSSSSESGEENEKNIPKIVEPDGEAASIKSDVESISSRKSSTSESEIKPPSESSVPEIRIRYPTDEPEVEKLPSEEFPETEDQTSKSSSSSSSSSSESEDEPINEVPHESPTAQDRKSPDIHNKADEHDIDSLEPEDNRDLTNGESVETPNVAETENDNISEKADSEASLSSSDDNDEIEANEEIVHTQAENVSKVEVHSYAQLVTPAGFAAGAGLATEEVANDNVPEEHIESDHDSM